LNKKKYELLLLPIDVSHFIYENDLNISHS